MASYTWLTISPTSGKGPGTVIATIPTHSGYATRSKSVVVSASIGGTTTSKSVTFKQTGASIPGTGSVKLGGVSYTEGSLTPSKIAQNAGNTLSFNLDGTNAKDFQYYVEFNTGVISQREITSILSAPSINSTIKSIAEGTMITISSLTSTTTSSNGNFRIIYSLPETYVNKAIGEHQTYSIAVDSIISGTYTNDTANAVTVKYGINAVVATGTNMTETSVIPIKSLSVTYPASSGFVVDGGGEFTSVSSTSVIEIDVPTDVTWTASVSGGRAIQ